MLTQVSSPSLEDLTFEMLKEEEIKKFDWQGVAEILLESKFLNSKRIRIVSYGSWLSTLESFLAESSLAPLMQRGQVKLEPL